MQIRVPDRHLQAAVSATFKELLSTRHLYQSLDVPKDFIAKELLEVENKKDAESLFIKRATLAWNIRPKLTEPNGQELGSQISIGNVDLYCQSCKRMNPFEHVSFSVRTWGYASSSWQTATTGQAFGLGFRCHGCQEFAVDFLVIRKVLKLTIAGRWPVETIPIPSHLPKACKKHYSDALVASNAGQILAGIFLLRTFIEQYWVSLGLREEVTRTTGQDMGAAYKAFLPDDFKTRFPSLSELYDDLSVAIHSADANHDLFRSSMEKINEHFEAKKIFKIKDEGLNPKSN